MGTRGREHNRNVVDSSTIRGRWAKHSGGETIEALRPPTIFSESDLLALNAFLSGLSRLTDLVVDDSEPDLTVTFDSFHESGVFATLKNGDLVARVVATQKGIRTIDIKNVKDDGLSDKGFETEPLSTLLKTYIKIQASKKA